MLPTLLKETTNRGRVYDVSGVLVADSARILRPQDISPIQPNGKLPGRKPKTENNWTRLVQWLMISSDLRVYKEIGGLNTEYLATKEMPEIMASLPLGPEDKELLHMCSNSTSLGEMCEASSLLDLQVCKTVWAFLIVGALMKA